jgi:hypothetical protein
MVAIRNTGLACWSVPHDSSIAATNDNATNDNGSLYMHHNTTMSASSVRTTTVVVVAHLRLKKMRTSQVEMMSRRVFDLQNV